MITCSTKSGLFSTRGREMGVVNLLRHIPGDCEESEEVINNDKTTTTRRQGGSGRAISGAGDRATYMYYGHSAACWARPRMAHTQRVCPRYETPAQHSPALREARCQEMFDDNIPSRKYGDVGMPRYNVMSSVITVTSSKIARISRRTYKFSYVGHSFSRISTLYSISFNTNTCFFHIKLCSHCIVYPRPSLPTKRYCSAVSYAFLNFQ